MATNDEHKNWRDSREDVIGRIVGDDYTSGLFGALHNVREMKGGE